MKRTPSWARLQETSVQEPGPHFQSETLRQPQLTSACNLRPESAPAPGRAVFNSSSSGQATISGAMSLPFLPEDGVAHPSCSSPWAYGADPGDDVWSPPPNCQTHDGSAPGPLSKCSFCHRKLWGTDIFMYRGEKAFCSLQCRQHQMLMDARQETLKLSGKRFSMVPALGAGEAIELSGSAAGHAPWLAQALPPQRVDSFFT